jgi:centromere protein J
VPLENERIHKAIYNAFYHANPIFTREVYPETSSISKNCPSQQPLQNGDEEMEDARVSEKKNEQSTTDGDSEAIYSSNHLSRTHPEKENVTIPLSALDSHTSQQSKLQATQNSSTVLKPKNQEKVYSDGRKEIWYPNGNLKKISADGSLIKMIYYNGDVKETLSDGTVKYFYAETKTWHTTYSDGQEILEFPE